MKKLFRNREEHWRLDRLVTTNNVTVTIGWRDVDCGLPHTDSLRVAAYDTSGTGIWRNLGQGTVTGDTITGTVSTASASTIYGPFALANHTAVTAHAGPDRVMEQGDTVTIGTAAVPGWEYAWTPTAHIEHADSATTRAWPSAKTAYTLEVTAENGCVARDTAIVYITVVPESEGTSSLDFVVNNGQLIDTEGNLRPDIGIYSHNAGPMLYGLDNRLAFVHARIDTIASTPDTLARVDIRFHETHREASPLGMGQNPHHYNYYLAHCPQGVTMTPSYNRVVYPELYENTDLHVSGNNAWMKFEFVIHPGGDPEDILMTFEGADNVQLIEQTGSVVVVGSSLGTYVFPRPKALKIVPLGNVVELDWQPQWDLGITGDTLRFINIGSYDPEEVLVFRLGEEPVELAAGGGDNLEWSTYLGGAHDDYVYDVVTVDNGSVYALGATRSFNFPANPATSASVAQPNFGGDRDAFVTRFDSQAALMWSTYYGGSSPEFADDIALGGIDAADQDFFSFTGITWCEDFPTQPFGSYYYQEHLGGERDAFIVLLKPDGQRAWATYFGGNTMEMAYAIKKNGDGDFYLCGSVAGAEYEPNPSGPHIPVIMSNNYCGTPTNNGFPLCDSGGDSFFDDTPNGFTHYQGYDAYVARFNENGLQWSTLFGGNAKTTAWDLVINPNDNSVVVTGYTSSTTVGNNDQNAPCDPAANNGFPLCKSASEYLQQTSPLTSTSSMSAYIAQFNEDNELVWSTFFGGADRCYGNGIAFNSSGDLYLVGAAEVYSSSDLPDNFCAPPTNGGFPLCNPGNGAYYRDNDNNAFHDVFISRFSQSKQLLWSTYYGGSGSETPPPFFLEAGTADIVIDEADRAYVLFSTENKFGEPSDVDVFPVSGFYNQDSNVGSGYDAFITSFNSSNQPLWGTYFGGGGTTGTGSEYGLSMSLFEDWLYIGGMTLSSATPQRCPTSYPNPYCQATLSSSGFSDGFIARFDVSEMPTGIVESESTDINSLIIYPNPTTGEVTILLEGQSNRSATLSVYDMVGRELEARKIAPFSGTHNERLDFMQYPNGLYLVKVSIGQDVSVSKVIKQR